MSICTAYLPYRYVERWGGCADECHEIVIWQASPRCGINSLSHLSLMSWTDIYRVTRCVLGRSGVNAAGIYAIRLLKAGCASSAVGPLRPLCDGFRAWLFHIDKFLRIVNFIARRTTSGPSTVKVDIVEGSGEAGRTIHDNAPYHGRFDIMK